MNLIDERNALNEYIVKMRDELLGRPDPTQIAKPNLFQRLNKVMQAVTYLKKDGVVSIKTKTGAQVTYKTISHDAVTAAIRQHMVENGIVPIVNVLACEQVEAITKMHIRLDLVNMDDTDRGVSYTIWAYGQDYGDKGPGKALSLGVKNLYLKALMLETGEDDESRIGVVPSSVHIDAPQLSGLRDLMVETTTEESALCDYISTAHGIELPTLAALPRNLYAFARAKLESKQRRMGAKP